MGGMREDEKKSTEFSFHALRFIQVIETSMKHLGSPSSLDPLFLNLGKIHARHEQHLPHNWAVFKECVLFHFRKAMKMNNQKACLTVGEIDSAEHIEPIQTLFQL